MALNSNQTSSPFSLALPKLSQVQDSSSDEEEQEPVSTELHPLKQVVSHSTESTLSSRKSVDGTLYSQRSSNASSTTDVTTLRSPSFKQLSRTSSGGVNRSSSSKLEIIDFSTSNEESGLNMENVIVELAEGAVIRNTDPLTIKLHSFFDDLFSTSISKRELAFREVCEICWLGGHNYQIYIGSSGCIEVCVEVLHSNLEPLSLKVRSLQLLSIILRNCAFNQNKAAQCGLIPVLAQLLVESVPRIRMWACNVMFSAVWNNFDLQQECRAFGPLIPSRLRSIVKDDWRVWPHNDAVEVLKLMDWKTSS
ncbi:hypothetical protein GEMRC1_013908 [Eukaryota sp. GEM-RC1]